MTQKYIFPDSDNKVRISFSVDLSLATELEITFGAESYTLTGNPTIVSIEDTYTLALDLNATNEIGRVFLKVKYFDSGTVLGEEITSQAVGNLDRVIIAVGSQLIIEDGTNVANANSFCTDAELNSWADLYGYKLPATEPERDAAQAMAFMKLGFYETKVSGSRLDLDQKGLFPRTDCEAKGFTIGSSVIPTDIKIAQMMMTVNIGDGATINSFVAGAVATTTSGSAGGQLASMEIPGVIKKSYHAATAESTAAAASTAVNASFPAVDEILAPYMVVGGSTGTVGRLERR
ncbi:MAG: hypothetical protein GY928_16425 [Colwellia sp.]|nr:hypothetical protein [Colwellia sp.]